MPLDPYHELGVAVDATEAQIKAAYRKRVRQVHPDRNPDDPFAAAKAAQVNAAYAILGDPARRTAFDRGETATPLDLSQAARALVIQVFLQSVASIPGARLIESIRGQIRNSMTGLKAEATKGRAANTHLEKLKKRYACNQGAHNFLADAIDGTCDNNKRQIAEIEGKLAIHEHALELLKAFSDTDTDDLVRLGSGTIGAFTWST